MRITILHALHVHVWACLAIGTCTGGSSQNRVCKVGKSLQANGNSLMQQTRTKKKALLASSAQEALTLPTWENGEAAWKAASRAVSGDRKGLWYQPNACDPDVLRASAPLTVLFSLATYWPQIQERRATIGSTSQPLEIHVVGASYPFEGRSDWTLLSRFRPSHVPRVRLVLILGTPFQSDNVPPMGGGLPNSLLARQAQQQQPQAGRWDTSKEEIQCTGDGAWGTRGLDQSWSKAELCRDHGNGVEVVCVEKYYQDAKGELAPPDLAVLFSPGFPQLGRRSWDSELRWMLQERVPILVSDLVVMTDWGHDIFQSGRRVPPGGRWNVRAGPGGEEAMTLSCMQSYSAVTVGAFRSPFPIIHEEENSFLAKNAIVQMFVGYSGGHEPVLPPSAAEVDRSSAFLKTVNWEELGVERDLQVALSTPVSDAYDHACKGLYEQHMRNLAQSKGCSEFTSSTRERLAKLGLCDVERQHDTPNLTTRWSSTEWIFIIKVLGRDVLDAV